MQGTQQAIPGHPATGLQRSQRPALAAWYAGPVAAGEQAMLRQAAASGLQARLCRGDPGFSLQLLQLVCDFMGGTDIEPGYRQLSAVTRDERQAALLELVMGQLLISRKLQPAMTHLEQGFLKAARHLETADYFCLVRRHERLGSLVLTDTPAATQSLEALLTEAAVIRRLRGNARRRNGYAHYDTLG